MTVDQRKPQAFILDDEPTPQTKPRGKAKVASLELTFDPVFEPQDVVTVPRVSQQNAPRRFRWLALLMSAIFALIVMWIGLTVTQLVESIFARNLWLGWLALGLASVVGLSALAIIIREIVGLLRLNKIEELQEKAARAINLDEKKSANETVSALETIYASRPDLAWGLAQLKSHQHDILDPSDRVHLAETFLMKPLDEEAHRIIARRAKRVTLLTTITPAAALDILFVAMQNLGMLREIATLYGGKPSTLATLKLARMVITHLAIAGGLSLSDGFLQHFIGKGLLGRLSARFGEGAVNGILTSRIGLAACTVCRPIPRRAGTTETLTSLIREVMTFSGGKSNDPPAN